MKLYDNWDYMKESYIFNLIDDQGLNFNQVAKKFEEQFNEKISPIDVEIKYRALLGEDISERDLKKIIAKYNTKHPAEEIFSKISLSKRGRKKSFSDEELERLVNDMDKYIAQGEAPTNVAKKLAPVYGKSWSTIYGAYKDYKEELYLKEVDKENKIQNQQDIINDIVDIISEEFGEDDNKTEMFEEFSKKVLFKLNNIEKQINEISIILKEMQPVIKLFKSIGYSLKNKK